ncbi:succinyl-diaminopimelate desuccinylase [Candidatus Endowatersipora endosymbiont of Watersipora subatra]|uniref:succinyl-diaminopimelate desuccinylase n=1 Tax=Candidatus Endowatersipora endosymbiont of Watersipora subatra TaxID=3077946 RepID=UPI00312CA424
MSDLSNAAVLLRDLIRCSSVTPFEGGALSLLQHCLERLGFVVIRKIFGAPGTEKVENLYARLGNRDPNLCFSGHIDVVPAGDLKTWVTDPFEAVVVEDKIIGRGAVDMKGGISCFVAAVERFTINKKNMGSMGSISFLITADEEGPAINGTAALLDWLVRKNEKIDACIVGEPTNRSVIGDTIKIGRRGSLSGTLTVNGIQGHTAYPDLADNPVRGITTLIISLMTPPFDKGTKNFQATNLEVTSLDTDNHSFNMITQKATALFNVRFNDLWTVDTIKKEIDSRLITSSQKKKYRSLIKNQAKEFIDFNVSYTEQSSPAFLTLDWELINTLTDAVEQVCGYRPALSTGGGTSDARFIKDLCPVVEFGLVSLTMHQINEQVSLTDLDLLTDIYAEFIRRYFELRSSL